MFKNMVTLITYSEVVQSLFSRTRLAQDRCMTGEHARNYTLSNTYLFNKTDLTLVLIAIKHTNININKNLSFNFF